VVRSQRYHPWRRLWRMMGNHLVLPDPTGARNHLILPGPTGALLLLRHHALCPPSDGGRWWPRCTGKERLRCDRSSHCGSARPRSAAGTWLAVALSLIRTHHHCPPPLRSASAAHPLRPRLSPGDRLRPRWRPHRPAARPLSPLSTF
jgi:hypothetical protein